MLVRKYSVQIGGSILCCGAAATQESVRDRELEQCQHCECAKAHSWLSWQSRIRGRSCREQSLLHRQNASLKEPDEYNKRYPWKIPTPAESEPVTTPSPVGPIALWRAAMIPKYDLMMIEFIVMGRIGPSRNEASITRLREWSCANDHSV